MKNVFQPLFYEINTQFCRLDGKQGLNGQDLRKQKIIYKS